MLPAVVDPIIRTNKYCITSSIVAALVSKDRYSIKLLIGMPFTRMGYLTFYVILNRMCSILFIWIEIHLRDGQY